MFRRPRARLTAISIAVCSFLGVAVPSVAPVSASANIQNQVNAILDELDRLEAQMDIISEDYAEAIVLQESLDKEIEEAKVRVAAKEAELAGMRQDLLGVAKQAFMNGGRSNSLTALLTDVGGLNALVQREHFLAVALNAGANSSDELDALVEDIAGASPRFWIGSCAHWATLWPTSVISVCIGATPTKCSVVMLSPSNGRLSSRPSTKPRPPSTRSRRRRRVRAPPCRLLSARSASRTSTHAVFPAWLSTALVSPSTPGRRPV